MASLRGRTVPKMAIDELGLKEINLQYNYLSSKFLRSLEKRLVNDTGMKLIDLRYNYLKEEDILPMLKSFKQNFSILSLDLRKNLGYSVEVKKRLALILLKNIEHNYKKKKTIKKNWVRKDLIFIDDESRKLNIQFDSQKEENRMHIKSVRSALSSMRNEEALKS